MAIGPGDDAGTALTRPPDTVAAAGVVLPAGAYDEPQYSDFVLGAGVLTLVAVRDIQRAAFIVMRGIVNAVLSIRPGTNPLAQPFTVAANDPTAVFRYVDLLTVVTGEFYALSAAGETITVATVRRH